VVEVDVGSTKRRMGVSTGAAVAECAVSQEKSALSGGKGGAGRGGGKGGLRLPWLCACTTDRLSAASTQAASQHGDGPAGPVRAREAAARCSGSAAAGSERCATLLALLAPPSSRRPADPRASWPRSKASAGQAQAASRRTLGSRRALRVASSVHDGLATPLALGGSWQQPSLSGGAAGLRRHQGASRGRGWWTGARECGSGACAARRARSRRLPTVSTTGETGRASSVTRTKQRSRCWRPQSVIFFQGSLGQCRST